MADDWFDDEGNGRLELRQGGVAAGWIDYRPAGADVILAHTEVLPGHEGQGLGSRLVVEALDRFAARGQLVYPTCPFAMAYLARHPDLADRVHPGMRAQVLAAAR